MDLKKEPLVDEDAMSSNYENCSKTVEELKQEFAGLERQDVACREKNGKEKFKKLVKTLDAEVKVMGSMKNEIKDFQEEKDVHESELVQLKSTVNEKKSEVDLLQSELNLHLNAEEKGEALHSLKLDHENCISSIQEEKNEGHDIIDTSWFECDVPTNPSCCQPANKSAGMGIAAVVEKNMANIKHAYQCSDAACLRLKCKALKNHVQHKTRCKLCRSCQLFNNVIFFHAGHQCRDWDCRIPDCVEYKCIIEATLYEERLKEVPRSFLPPPDEGSDIHRSAGGRLIQILNKIQYLMKACDKMEQTAGTMTETTAVTDEKRTLEEDNLEN